jgi:hypothetical protein
MSVSLTFSMELALMWMYPNVQIIRYHNVHVLAELAIERTSKSPHELLLASIEGRTALLLENASRNLA